MQLVHRVQVLAPLTGPDLVWLSCLPGISEEVLFRGALIPGTFPDWSVPCRGLIYKLPSYSPFSQQLVNCLWVALASLQLDLDLALLWAVWSAVQEFLGHIGMF